jgi:basic amino acid/polyamine antiporter, APA family
MKSDEGLLRAIGPVGLALSIVNVTVGGSIFVLPAALARELGTAAPAAYLAGTAVMALVALGFAQAGRRTTVSGGPYAYVERAFGRFPGYLAGLLTWLATIVACGAVGAALVDSLATMIPALHLPLARAFAVVLTFALLALVNVRGVRAGTALASTAGVAKFVGLVLFVLLAARFVQESNLQVTLPSHGSGLGRATARDLRPRRDGDSALRRRRDSGSGAYGAAGPRGRHAAGGSAVHHSPPHHAGRARRRARRLRRPAG